MQREQFNEPITRQVTVTTTADGAVSVLQPLDNILVTVYRLNEDGTRQANPAALYAASGPGDNTVFAPGNPFVTGANGKTGFWADNGDYEIVLHDQNQIARIGDQSVFWRSGAGGDAALSKMQLPEYGRALAPAGAIMSFAGTGDPPGWLLCDGRVLAQANYPDLYAAIGAAYGLGNEGAGNFRVPDYRGRSIIAPDDMGTAQGAAARLSSLAAAARARGQSGGADTVTLAANHLPAHSHNATSTAAGTGISVNTGTAAIGVDWHSAGNPLFDNTGPATGYVAGSAGSGGNADIYRQSKPTISDVGHGHGVTDPQHSHAITVNDAGQTRGAAHSNLHPYQISNIIIKI